MRLMRAIKASLGADKQAYIVGDAPTFRIIGAKTGASIQWTTWRNGEVLEYEASHGEVIGSNGTAELTHPAFTDDDVGYWEKQVIILATDGSQDAAQIFFTVSPVAQAVEPTAQAAPGFFDQRINLFGFELPTWLVIGGGLLLVFKLGKK